MLRILCYVYHNLWNMLRIFGYMYNNLCLCRYILRIFHFNKNPTNIPCAAKMLAFSCRLEIFLFMDEYLLFWYVD